MRVKKSEAVRGGASSPSAALGAIARAALCVYATEGEKPSQFDDVDPTK